MLSRCFLGSSVDVGTFLIGLIQISSFFSLVKWTPVRLSRECVLGISSVSLNVSVSRNNRIKRVVPCQCLDGHVKEPYEMYIAFGARP